MEVSIPTIYKGSNDFGCDFGICNCVCFSHSFILIAFFRFYLVLTCDLFKPANNLALNMWHPTFTAVPYVLWIKISCSS